MKDFLLLICTITGGLFWILVGIALIISLFFRSVWNETKP